MISVTKAASDIQLRHHESAQSQMPLGLIASNKSNDVSKHRSGNNLPSRKRLGVHSSQQIKHSIHDNYQKLQPNDFTTTHLPIASTHEASVSLRQTSSSRLPTVPNQAGTFIHRLMNKFFSITNVTKKASSRPKRVRIARLTTRNLSGSSDTLLSPASNRRRRRPYSKGITHQKDCVVCRKHRRRISTSLRNPVQPIFLNSFEHHSQSPMLLNSNATTTPSLSFANNSPSKRRALTDSQCRTIASALELIFDTLISNYYSILS